MDVVLGVQAVLAADKSHWASSKMKKEKKWTLKMPTFGQGNNKNKNLHQRHTLTKDPMTRKIESRTAIL